MFDLLEARASSPQTAAANAASLYAGPERRRAQGPHWRWLALMLDEIDHGMVLLLDAHHVVHANHVAISEFDQEHPLQLLGRELRARHSADVAPLHEALAAATQRGLRRLLTLGRNDQPVSVAVVPLGGAGGGAGDERCGTLLVFGRRRACPELSAQAYARSHDLTQAETAVLQLLCAGDGPNEIAGRHHVAISTVRTQISSIRAKTGTASIRQLVQRVAVLPPLVSALRSGRVAPTQERPSQLSACA
jgi:DNA-binding CsgD family transcriptional regulator